MRWPTRAWVLAIGAALAVASGCGGSTETGAGGSGPVGTGGGGGDGGVGGSASGGAPTGTGGSDELGLLPQSCPDDSYAVDIDADGMLVCAPFDGDVPSAVDTHCALHLGWRDSCSGCDEGPAKAGRVNGSGCDNLGGADNTCTSPALGGVTTPLFGLNTDGDVDGNDMFYLGWHCAPAGESGLVGPCAPGEHAVSVTVDGYVECMPSDRLIANYVRNHCSVLLGWRDGCDGCTQPPSKWGSQRGHDCIDGAGADNACGGPLLGGQWVTTIGINTDGDVDDNDTFFVGLYCDDAAARDLAAETRCPFGTLLSGVNEDGTLRCTSTDAAVAPVVQQACRLTFGYRDGCSGCTDPPTKWGTTGSSGCNAGTSSTCGSHQLGGTSVDLLGIRTDGDVDGNDKFYVGLSCE
jgi:hypothetical protein